MRTRRTNRVRIFFGAALFLVLGGAPLLLGLTRPPANIPAEVPTMVGVYASGLSSLGTAGLVAIPLAMLFALWLIAGQRREVNRRWLQQSARNRRNFLEFARSFAVIAGAAAIIVGSLAGLYAAIIAARPDLKAALSLPLTFDLALPCVLIGGLLYVLGRVGR